MMKDRIEDYQCNEGLSLAECYPAAGAVPMKRFQVYWKTDWSGDVNEQICTAPSKESVIRDYHLRSVDVIWFEIHEIPKI